MIDSERYEDIEWRLRTGKLVEWKALDARVICVAVEGAVEDWSAYVGAVPGESHEREWYSVYSGGSKLPQEVASGSC